MVNGAGIAVMILKEGKVLLGKRNDDPVKAGSKLHGEGTWTLPGGKIEFHESFEDAAFREVEEETGIRVKKERMRFISVSNDMVHDAHFITLGFLSEDFEGEPEAMEPEEITEWRWFDLHRLPGPMFFPSEKVIKNFLAREVYKH
ncbi:MAG: NUDIX domain-containing protein [Desulfomonilia bacterium]|nr:NUDIX domain-containing protein [Desulfomonilia bacterium]